MKKVAFWSMASLVCLSIQFVWVYPQQCIHDSDCQESEVCAPDHTCVLPWQDLGSPVCRRVQLSVQQAVLEESPFATHGHLVRTVARAVSRWVDSGILTADCAGAIVNQFARGVPIEEQEAVGPDPACGFSISGTLIAEPGSDYDTLEFTNSTFVMEIRSDDESVPTIETLSIAGVPYIASSFDLTTSEGAVHWSPSGSALDGTYAAPSVVTFTDNRPAFIPGIPDPVGLVDEIELTAPIDIEGVEYELRMLFYFDDAEAFDEFELGSFCTFQTADSATITVQQLSPVPWSPDASFDLRVVDMIITKFP